MEKYTILKSDFFDEIDNSLLVEAINKHSYSKELTDSPYPWAKYLKCYISLTHLIDNRIDELSLYMSRYYWFKKFYYEYSKSNGVDVGMEQQLVKILEIIGNNFKDFDWNEIQKIDNEIEMGV